MPTPVWSWGGERPQNIAPERWVQEIPLAPGLVKSVDKDIVHTTDDGTGNSGSVRGARRFSQTFRNKIVGAGEDGTAIIQFCQARENDGASFYWYLPYVTAPPDATGVTVAGRLLVRIPAGKWSYSHTHKVKGVTITVQYEEVAV